MEGGRPYCYTGVEGGSGYKCVLFGFALFWLCFKGFSVESGRPYCYPGVEGVQTINVFGRPTSPRRCTSFLSPAASPPGPVCVGVTHFKILLSQAFLLLSQAPFPISQSAWFRVSSQRGSANKKKRRGPKAPDVCSHPDSPRPFTVLLDIFTALPGPF